jgi:hypothetical protein
MVFSLRRRSTSRLLIILGLLLCLRLFSSHFLSPTRPSPNTNPHEIPGHNALERITHPDKAFNVQKHKFLQVRMGRDQRDDLLGDIVRNGVRDFWERFQKPQ